MRPAAHTVILQPWGRVHERTLRSASRWLWVIIEPESLEFARGAAALALVEDEVRQYVEAWRSALRPAAAAASAHTTALVVSAGIVSTGFAWSRSADRAPIEQMVREICELTARTLR